LDAEGALHVSLESFRIANQSFYSPLTTPELPSQYSFVQSIYGLSNYGSEQNFASPMYRTFGRISGQPQQSDSNSIYYTPSEMHQIYNSSSLINAGYTGAGITIAIIDAFGDPFIQEELNNFSKQFNLPLLMINQICVDGPCNYANGVTQGWQPEIALDVEWAHAMAPNAAINLYIGSNSSFPLEDAVEQAVLNSSNSIISMSWGTPENSYVISSPIAPFEGAQYAWLDQVLQQAAVEGITAFSSSGDWGAYDQGLGGETLPYGGAIYPSTDPYVTGVGGTSLYMSTTSGTIQFPYSNATGGYGSETAWSWSNTNGWSTGGGYSTLYPAPPWQHGTGFDSSKGTKGSPDVAWDADPATGVAISLFDTGLGAVSYFVEGGTSVGSPSWAGSMALLDQKAGGRLGLITPALYSILNNPQEYFKAFHDVTSGNNNPYSAGVGWDPLTGLGSPNLGELANYIAPSGSLDVSVKNSLTGQLAASFAYGSQIGLTANITSNGRVVSSGTVVANITGSNGKSIANGVQFLYDSGLGSWTGSYGIKSTDPPGDWTAKVLATVGPSSGWGITTLSVGDGISVYLPYFNLTTNANLVPKFAVGQTINITAKITSPDSSCCVTTGNFRATFTENSPTGKNEGSIPLSYNSTLQKWTAHFKIPPGVDQDSWVMNVSGTDSSGNLGSTYGWLYVGLNMILSTDSPTYVLGDTISVKTIPEYRSGFEASTGSFTATISDGSKVIATLPLILDPTAGVWLGKFTLAKSAPTGFYQISVSGNDGRGSAGIAETIVRVAPYTLQGAITLPSPTISVNGGSEAMVSAKMTYPNGSIVTQGSVDAFVYLNHEGLLFPVSLVRLTYAPSSESFVGPYLFGVASPLNTSLGSYLVSVQGFDAAGNYANLTTSVFVQGETHSPISITNNSQFTAENGVLQGSGSSTNPFVIAGWNTTSISISGGATSVYRIINDWVSGNSGDGIFLNTSSASLSQIEDTYSNSNGGSGIVANGIPGITILGDVTSGNHQSGIVVGNESSSLIPQISLTVSEDNGVNGFSLQNGRIAMISDNAATGNGKFGFYLDNLPNATLTFNNATRNPVGIYLTGNPGQNNGEAQLFYTTVFDNGVGVQINGLNQNVTGSATNSSAVVVELSLIENNTVGVLAENDSEVRLSADTIGHNGDGAVFKNSLALVADDVISQNNNTALSISGGYVGRGGCIVTFITNSTRFIYSSCVLGNFISLNGNSSKGDGIDESNLNGSIVFSNLDSKNGGNGINLFNVTGSSISMTTFDNNSGDGVYASSISHDRIGMNNMSSDLNGIVLAGGSTNQLDRNNLSIDSFDGILLDSSTNNAVTKNSISSVGAECASTQSCLFAGGIHLSNDSAQNSITSNSVSGNTVVGKIGAGLLLTSGSSQNFVYQNNATNNDAGIAISGASSNTVARNDFSSNKYGIYLVNSQGTDLSSNNLARNQQDVYPNIPLVSFSDLRNGTKISGDVVIRWNSTGQAISNQSISIDGSPQTVSGTSYTWNSTSLSDGIHVITIRVTNAAGQNASASLIISTINHEFLTIDTIGPGQTPISFSLIELKNSTYSASETTDSSGRAIFHGLSSGSYNASTSINGTEIISPVNYSGNSTVVLFVPILDTTALATRVSGGSVPIQVTGNILASQMSNITLQNSNGGYLLFFDLNGANGTSVSATLQVLKSSTASGLVPNLIINGKTSQNQSYFQDQNYYYVKFLVRLNGTEKMSVQYSPSAPIFDIRYVVVLVAAIAIIVAGLLFVFRRKSKRSYYLPSQQN